MKKIFVYLLIFLLLTGCTFEYNVKIGKNYFEEIGYVKNYDKDTWKTPDYLGNGKTYVEIINSKKETFASVYREDVDSYIDPYYKNDEYEYYDVEVLNDEDAYGLKYSYKGDLEKYYDTRMLNMCYDKTSVVDNDGIVSVKTSNNFDCFRVYTKLDEVKVNVTTSWDYKIVSSNADIISDDKHTWVINKSNASNKPIEFEVKKVFNWRLTLIIVIPIIVVGVVTYFILKNKRARDSEI